MSWQDAKAYDDALIHPSSSSSSSKSVSTTSAAANVIYTTARQLQPESPTFAAKPPLFFEAVLRNTSRSEAECIWLAKGVPKPPSGFRFSRRQIDEQLDFFKYQKQYIYTHSYCHVSF
jgi:hypothetical protein